MKELWLKVVGQIIIIIYDFVFCPNVMLAALAPFFHANANTNDKWKF